MLAFINGVLVPFIFAIAFLVFVWGIFKYFILGGGEQASRDEGKQFMLYGIAGFVIMVSVWGIVNLLSSGLGFNQSAMDRGGCQGQIQLRYRQHQAGERFR